MKKTIVVLLSLAFAGLFYCSHAQSINPATQIQWPRLTGTGVPTAACSATNYGQPYTNLTNNAAYVCGTSGWILTGAAPIPVTPNLLKGDNAGGVSNSGIDPATVCLLDGTHCPATTGFVLLNPSTDQTITQPEGTRLRITESSATTPTVSIGSATASGSSAYAALESGIDVTNPGVFGYTGIYTSCVNHVDGAICYAASTMAVDATDGSAYTHNVALNPQVKQSDETQTPGVSGKDYYGVAAGFELGPGVWPGSGFRVEGPVGVTSANGQINVGYDMVYGITPTALFARPGCRTDTCNSADIRLQGVNGGTLNDYSSVFADYLGNFRISTPGNVVINPINSGTATSGANINSSKISLTASGWNGTAASDYLWNIFHNINAAGTVSASHLQIVPPSGLSADVVSVDVGSTVNIDGNATISKAGQFTDTPGGFSAPSSSSLQNGEINGYASAAPDQGQVLLSAGGTSDYTKRGWAAIGSYNSDIVAIGLGATTYARFGNDGSFHVGSSFGVTSAGVASMATGSTVNSSTICTAATGCAVSGTVPIANGGTNATSQTTNGVMYYDGTKITSGSGLTAFTFGTNAIGIRAGYSAGARGDFNGSSFSFNRDSSNGAIFDSTQQAYQFQHIPSTTRQNDYMCLQAYTSAGVQVAGGLSFCMNDYGSVTINKAPSATSAGLDVAGGIAGTSITDSGLTASKLVATDASKVLVSITALPSGTTATTQSAGDNSTKVATTAYVDAAANTVYRAHVITTAVTSENFTVTGVEDGGYCSVTPEDATAATNLTTTYYSVSAADTVTLTHTATAGMGYTLICTN